MAFEQLKARQGDVWGAGDFAKVAESLADVHDVLVDRLDPRPGERRLDVASVASLEPERRDELHAAWLEHFEDYRDGSGIAQPREYVLVRGIRR